MIGSIIGVNPWGQLWQIDEDMNWQMIISQGVFQNNIKSMTIGSKLYGFSKNMARESGEGSKLLGDPQKVHKVRGKRFRASRGLLEDEQRASG